MKPEKLYLQAGVHEIEIVPLVEPFTKKNVVMVRCTDDNTDIIDLDERMKGSDTYFKKELRRRKRNTEKYIDELIHEIELLKLRKQQFDLDEYNSKFEQSESNDIENLPEI